MTACITGTSNNGRAAWSLLILGGLDIFIFGWPRLLSSDPATQPSQIQGLTRVTGSVPTGGSGDGARVLASCRADVDVAADPVPSR